MVSLSTNGRRVEAGTLRVESRSPRYLMGNSASGQEREAPMVARWLSPHLMGEAEHLRKLVRRPEALPKVSSSILVLVDVRIDDGS